MTKFSLVISSVIVKRSEDWRGHQRGIEKRVFHSEMSGSFTEVWEIWARLG